jgi:hypothetical protein
MAVGHRASRRLRLEAITQADHRAPGPRFQAQDHRRRFPWTEGHPGTYELVRERAEIRFGTQITEARLAEDGVEVVLSDGRAERCDVLVGADGIHSNVRGLVFGAGFTRPLGGYYIAVTQVLRHGLPPATHCYWGVGQMVTLLAVDDDSVSTMADHAARDCLALEEPLDASGWRSCAPPS